jgi:hypothetical protein
MPRLAWSWAVALFLSTAAAAAPPDLQIRPLSLALAAATEREVCTVGVAPEPWRDASDARWFATGPTSRLDMHGLWVGVLVPLVNLRIIQGTAHTLVLGVPLQAGVRLTSAGWRLRWPGC